MSYETILSISGGDHKKAWDLWREAERRFDVSSPMPLWSGEASKMFALSHERLDDEWRRVRACYQGIRGQYEIIDERNPFFREALTQSEFPVPFLYALGNISLLENERVTVLGTSTPTKEAEGDILDASAFINAHKLTLMAPLSIGVASLVMGEVLKESGRVIAVSDQFVTKAPSERLMNQMVDIMKRGGLIISPFGPASKSERWHQVIRNRAISALSDRVLLIEEKDGGPSWRIFDEVEAEGAVKICGIRHEGEENYSFIADRCSKGALRMEKMNSLRAFIPKREKKSPKWKDDETPSLFDL